jgi:hypothetical protein
MRLTIIPVDGTVIKDGKNFINLDLSSCEIPTDIHALQWEEQEPNKGHIEFKSALIQNQDITELPVWANACLVKWNEAKAVEEAAAEQARIAAEQLQPTEQ